MHGETNGEPGLARESVPRKEASESRNGSRLVWALCIIFAYIVVRSFVYLLLPTSNANAWFYRDLLMNGPRLVALIPVLLILRHSVGTVGISGGFPIQMSPVVFALVLVWVWYLNGATGEVYPDWMILSGTISSFVVGIWEEAAFRGLLLSSLASRGRAFAVTFSSGVFAIYHIQAQPISFWLFLFLIGIILAVLRFAGATLLFLSLIHGLFDALYFLFPNAKPEMFSDRGLICLLLMAIVACASFASISATASRKKPEGSNLRIY